MTDSLSYTIDATDTIVAVSGSWDEFAIQNDGAEVLSEKVIGQKLDQFIHGDETLMFVRTMIMSARVLQRPVLRPYRCDSPSQKRYMEMKVEPRSEGVVEVGHRELRSEPIVNSVRILAAPNGEGGSAVKRCSVCNRVRAQDVWSELDEAFQGQRLTPVESKVLKVIYGVCPDCMAGLKARTTASGQTPER